MYFLLLLAVREGMIKERVLQEGGTPGEMKEKLIQQAATLTVQETKNVDGNNYLWTYTKVRAWGW